MTRTNLQMPSGARLAPALLLTLGLSLPAAVHAAARADFATGDAKVVAADGRSRPLVKGDTVSMGETVDTGSGRAQLRFTDGAQVSLVPQTQFRIDEYKFAGQADGSEKGFFSLLKGGMRTITGLIGRKKRDNYKLDSVVATIGIRGTEFSVFHGNSINVTTGEGVVEVCNAAGCLIVNSGESAYVPDANTRPVMTDKKTELPPPPAEAPVAKFAAGEQTADDGTPAGLPQTPVSPEGFPAGSNLRFMSAEYRPDSGTHNATNTGTGVTLTADGLGIKGLNLFNTPAYERGNAGNFEGGADGGVIAWGRWAAGQPALYNWGQQTLTGDQGFHIVVGEPTTVFPQQASVSYALLGATRPTEARSGALGGWSVTGGGMVVDFISSALNGHLDLGLSRDAEQAAFLMKFSGQASQLASISTDVAVASGTTTLCGNGCSGSGKMLFAGAGASHAGMTYEFDAGSYYVQGAAAFKQGEYAPPPPPPPPPSAATAAAPASAPCPRPRRPRRP